MSEAKDAYYEKSGYQSITLCKEYIQELEQQNKEYKEKNDLLTNRNDSLEDDKQIFINECNELRRKKIELKKQNKELIDFFLHLYVNYGMTYGTMDIDTKKKFKELMKKFKGGI